MATKTTPEPGIKPEFLVVETNLHYQSKNQGELVLNLDFPFGLLVDASAGTKSEGEIFIEILESMGDSATLVKVRALGAIEGMTLVKRFFAELQKIIGAPLGE